MRLFFGTRGDCKVKTGSHQDSRDEGNGEREYSEVIYDWLVRGFFVF